MMLTGFPHLIRPTSSATFPRAGEGGRASRGASTSKGFLQYANYTVSQFLVFRKRCSGAGGPRRRAGANEAAMDEAARQSLQFSRYVLG
jgi:hypothetical protein